MTHDTCHDTWLAFIPAVGEGRGETTNCCPSTLHAHFFSREMKKPCSFFTLCVCPLLARQSKCTPSVFWRAHRCHSSQEPTMWLCSPVPDKGGDFC